MADSNNFIANPVGWTPASVLANSTGDMMPNIYDVLIKWPWEGARSGAAEVISDSEAAVSYRCKDFTIPEVEAPTYDVSWHGVVVKRIGSGIRMTREFKLSFRFDANYALYQKFLTWQKLTADVNTSGVANTTSALGTVQVIAPGSEYNSMSFTTPSNGSDVNQANLLTKSLPGATNLIWTFEDVAVYKIGQPKFSNEAEGKSQEYEVTFIFGDVAYPFYTAANGIIHNHKQTS